MQEFKETKSKKPCMGCPFKRVNTNEKPNPGGSHPFVYLGQARGPFWLPCHQDKNYQGKGSDVATVSQCRGAAIFRSNCGKSRALPKQLLDLPRDTEMVFESESEFLKHYIEDMSEDEVFALTSQEALEHMMMHEMNKKSSTRRTYGSNS